MSGTMISVPRETLDASLNHEVSSLREFARDKLRTLLAEPANKCGNCGAENVQSCNDRGCHFFESGNGGPVSHFQGEPASPATEWPRLDKPARVGATRFSAGVSARLVVEAAQRQHEYGTNPPEWMSDGTVGIVAGALSDENQRIIPVEPLRVPHPLEEKFRAFDARINLPERMPTGNNVEGEHNRLSPGVREGWNLYDDEVRRLNGIKP